MGSPLNRMAARQAPQDDAQATLLLSRVERHRADLRTLHEKQAAIVLAMRRSLKALERVPADLYSRKWFLEREDAIRAEARRALDAIEEVAAERRDTIRELATLAATHDPKSLQEAQLIELQKASAWASLRPLLESAAAAVDPITAIELVCERVGSDPVRLAALREFSGDWAAGWGAGKPRAEGRRLQETLIAAINAAELPTLSPVERTARDVLADLDRGMARLQASTHEVRREIEGRGAIAGAVAGYEDSAVVMLTHRGQPIPPEADSSITAAFSEQGRAFSLSTARHYPLLSEQGALRGTELDMSRDAQMYRSLGLPIPGSTSTEGE